jgi:hypothetical protein
MFILDSLLIGGIRFVLEKVAAAAEAEMNDDTALREQLLEAQIRLELGEISDADFAAIEHDILARIREIKGSQPAGALTITPRDARAGGQEGAAPGLTVDVESYSD